MRAFTRVWEGGVVLRASPRRLLPCHAFFHCVLIKFVELSPSVMFLS